MRLRFRSPPRIPTRQRRGREQRRALRRLRRRGLKHAPPLSTQRETWPPLKLKTTPRFHHGEFVGVPARGLNLAAVVTQIVHPGLAQTPDGSTSSAEQTTGRFRVFITRGRAIHRDLDVELGAPQRRLEARRQVVAATLERRKLTFVDHRLRPLLTSADSVWAIGWFNGSSTDHHLVRLRAPTDGGNRQGCIDTVITVPARPTGSKEPEPPPAKPPIPPSPPKPPVPVPPNPPPHGGGGCPHAENVRHREEATTCSWKTLPSAPSHPAKESGAPLLLGR